MRLKCPKSPWAATLPLMIFIMLLIMAVSIPWLRGSATFVGSGIRSQHTTITVSLRQSDEQTERTFVSGATEQVHNVWPLSHYGSALVTSSRISVGLLVTVIVLLSLSILLRGLRPKWALMHLLVEMIVMGCLLASIMQYGNMVDLQVFPVPVSRSSGFYTVMFVLFLYTIFWWYRLCTQGLCGSDNDSLPAPVGTGPTSAASEPTGVDHNKPNGGLGSRIGGWFSEQKRRIDMNTNKPQRLADDDNDPEHDVFVIEDLNDDTLPQLQMTAMHTAVDMGNEDEDNYDDPKYDKYRNKDLLNSPGSDSAPFDLHLHKPPADDHHKSHSRSKSKSRSRSTSQHSKDRGVSHGHDHDDDEEEAKHHHDGEDQHAGKDEEGGPARPHAFSALHNAMGFHGEEEEEEEEVGRKASEPKAREQGDDSQSKHSESEEQHSEDGDDHHHDRAPRDRHEDRHSGEEDDDDIEDDDARQGLTRGNEQKRK